MNKLSNKGQSLVLFVVMLPIFIIMGVYLIDIGYAKYEDNKLNNVCVMIIKYGLNNIDNNPKNNMEELLKKNINDIEDYNILVDNNNKFIKFTVNKTSSSFLGNIIGKSGYKEKCSYNGYIKDNKILIERDDI